MVTTLTSEELVLGRKIAMGLNEKVKVFLAAWTLGEGAKRYLLTLGIGELDSLGPRRVYTELQKILSDVTLTLQDTLVVGQNDDAAKFLLSLPKVKASQDPVRIEGTLFGDTYLEDALVFWTVRPESMRDEIRSRSSALSNPHP